MKDNILLLCLLIVIFVAGSRAGYAQDMDSVLIQYFHTVKSGGHPPLPTALCSTGDYSNCLRLLRPYLADSLVTVSAKACQLVHSMASEVSATDVRRDGVEMLLGAWSNPDVGINGTILSYLAQYRREDFTDPAKDTIRSLVGKQSAYFDRILKLAGFLNLTDLTPEMRPWTQPGNSTHIRWAAYLSLARMGDPAAIQEIVRRAKKLPVNDDVVYQIFPDLVYTRQKVLIDLMVDALQDDAKNCLTADPEREVPIPCGYRIMEQLANIIAGYPFVRNESGDLETNDYAEALSQTRAWFLQHKTYTILTDTY